MQDAPRCPRPLTAGLLGLASCESLDTSCPVFHIPLNMAHSNWFVVGYLICCFPFPAGICFYILLMALADQPLVPHLFVRCSAFLATNDFFLYVKPRCRTSSKYQLDFFLRRLLLIFEVLFLEFQRAMGRNNENTTS